MYIGASDLCNRIVIDMDQDYQYTRLWDIKVGFRSNIKDLALLSKHHIKYKMDHNTKLSQMSSKSEL